MKIETRPLTTSQSQRPCDSTFFLESHACLCFGKLVVNGRRGRATASFIAPSAQFLHFSPKGRREMVFGRSQRQETGFVIAGKSSPKNSEDLPAITNDFLFHLLRPKAGEDVVSGQSPRQGRGNPQKTTSGLGLQADTKDEPRFPSNR